MIAVIISSAPIPSAELKWFVRQRSAKVSLCQMGLVLEFVGRAGGRGWEDVRVEGR